MSSEQPAHLTPIAADDLRAALTDAWSQQFGTPPLLTQLAVLMAQSAFETGFWRSCMNYNLEGVKARPGGAFDWTYFATEEALSPPQARLAVAASTPAAPCSLKTIVPNDEGKLIVEFFPKHPTCCFRALPDLACAAADYLTLLHQRFAAAWPALLQGDAPGFVAALKTAGYFTAPAPQYLTGVLRCYGELAAQFLHYPTVAGYQAARGLAPDNLCGPLTYAAMRTDLAAAEPEPAP